MSKKFKITADSFSKEAAEKIKAAGGEAIAIKKQIKNPLKEEVKKGVKES